MKQEKYCATCGEVLLKGQRRFCSESCKLEYHILNKGMTHWIAPLNILRVLIEERDGGPMVMEYNAHVYRLHDVRRVPLILVRDVVGKRCVVEITDAGRMWYAKLRDSAAS